MNAFLISLDARLGNACFLFVAGNIDRARGFLSSKLVNKRDLIHVKILMNVSFKLSNVSFLYKYQYLERCC